MGFFKKLGKVIKKAAPIALGGYGIYQGLNALGGQKQTVGIRNPENGTEGGGSSTYGYGSQLVDFLKDNASSVISGGAKMLGGSIQNTANAQQAQKQMDFQAHQSNTAHQREVADLAAAGLNPILSGTGGMGASSASGASAIIGDNVSTGVDSYWNNKSQQASLAKLNAETNATSALEEKTKAETRLTDAVINKVAPDIANSIASTRALQTGIPKTKQETRNLRAQEGVITSSARSAHVAANVDEATEFPQKLSKWVQAYGSSAESMGKFMEMFGNMLPTPAKGGIPMPTRGGGRR